MGKRKESPALIVLPPLTKTVTTEETLRFEKPIDEPMKMIEGLFGRLRDGWYVVRVAITFEKRSYE